MYCGQCRVDREQQKSTARRATGARSGGARRQTARHTLARRRCVTRRVQRHNTVRYTLVPSLRCTAHCTQARVSRHTRAPTHRRRHQRRRLTRHTRGIHQPNHTGATLASIGVHTHNISALLATCSPPPPTDQRRQCAAAQRCVGVQPAPPSHTNNSPLQQTNNTNTQQNTNNTNNSHFLGNFFVERAGPASSSLVRGTQEFARVSV